MAIYIDTSALAKRYLLGRGSETFDAFFQQCDDDCVFPPPGSTESESILQRLRRERLIDADYAEDLGCRGFATGDRQLARAAARRGLTLHDFFSN